MARIAWSKISLKTSKVSLKWRYNGRIWYTLDIFEPFPAHGVLSGHKKAPFSGRPGQNLLLGHKNAPFSGRTIVYGLNCLKAVAKLP